MSEKRQNIVILGGGAFGVATAREIAPKLDMTRYRLIVINPRPYFAHLPGLIRTVVTAEGKLEEQILMEYGNFLNGKGEVKIGKVASFTSTKEGGEVVLSDGEKVPYSVLVLAPGSLWEGPLALPDEPEEVLQHINAWRAKFEKADSILLAGGGSVGIEMAGEIKDFFPRKSVTIVHAQDQLVNAAYPKKFRTQLLRRIRKTGAEVVLDDYVDSTEPSEDGTVTTRKGRKIKADLVVPTRGGRPNTSVIASSLGADTLTSSGHVKVQLTLQLPNHPRIFAAGDVIDWNEQKQAGKAPGHAAVIAKNAFALLSGGEASTLYKGSPEMILVTVGRNGGGAFLGLLWGLTFGDWFAAKIKSRGLIIEMVKNNYGLGKQ
ncbi:hypothetical protein NMY22_g13576 [Coprinellus aureogranulatus]|nr:hypothetical protein NMY22_g13576 [Coprinellus aureogranulatus]